MSYQSISHHSQKPTLEYIYGQSKAVAFPIFFLLRCGFTCQVAPRLQLKINTAFSLRHATFELNTRVRFYLYVGNRTHTKFIRHMNIMLPLSQSSFIHQVHMSIFVYTLYRIITCRQQKSTGTKHIRTRNLIPSMLIWVKLVKVHLFQFFVLILKHVF